jgi:hypothetical protein
MDKTILEGKKKIIEEEYSDDDFVVGGSLDVKSAKKDKNKETLTVGGFKRETLNNGQRIAALELDPEMVKGITPDSQGNVTISLASDRYRGEDFLSQDIKINLEEFKKMNRQENGLVKLIVFEKEAGGDIQEKKELVVMADTNKNRNTLMEKNPEVIYRGEEKLLERDEIMNTKITQNITFRDVYNRMNDKEKSEINKKENGELKTFVEQNKPIMSQIEDNIMGKEMEEKRTKGKGVYIGEGENKKKVVCQGVDTNGQIVYKEEGGKTHSLNPYQANEETSLDKGSKKKIVNESFRMAINKMDLYIKKNEGHKI